MVDAVCLHKRLRDYKIRYKIIVLVKSQKIWSFVLVVISIKRFGCLSRSSHGSKKLTKKPVKLHEEEYRHKSLHFLISNALPYVVAYVVMLPKHT